MRPDPDMVESHDRESSLSDFYDVSIRRMASEHEQTLKLMRAAIVHLDHLRSMNEVKYSVVGEFSVRDLEKCIAMAKDIHWRHENQKRRDVQQQKRKALEEAKKTVQRLEQAKIEAELRIKELESNQ